MKTLIACLFSVWLMTGCGFDTDPLGMTTRAQIRADAAVQMEHERTLAQQAEAQARVDAEIARQAGESHRVATWAMFIPVFLALIGATVLLGIVLHWRGRVAFENVRLQVAQRPTVVYLEAQPRSEYQLLRDYARARGGELTFAGGKPAMLLPGGRLMLIDKQEVL